MSAYDEAQAVVTWAYAIGFSLGTDSPVCILGSDCDAASCKRLIMEIGEILNIPEAVEAALADGEEDGIKEAEDQ